MLRNSIFFLFTIYTLLLISPCMAERAVDRSPSLPIAKNLFTDSAIARKEKKPILILISQHHCPFCDRIKHDILHPMIIAGDYQDRILMRELFIDQQDEITDLLGAPRSAALIAQSYGVNMTPTLLFLGADGEELSKRIIGYYTPEMFFYYVDEAIQQAIKALNP